MPVAIALPMSETEREEAYSRSGGACVRCGCTIACFCRAGTYDDGGGVSPAFLLCPDCMAIIDRGGVPEATIARLRDAPVARQAGLDRSPLLFTVEEQIPDIAFPGGARMTGTYCPITVDARPLLSFRPQPVPGGPMVMSMVLGVAGEEPDLIVKDNEWRPASDAWRFERRGNRYRFSHASGTALLAFAHRAADEIAVEAMRGVFGGKMLEIGENGAMLDGLPVTIPSVRSQLVGVHL